MPKKTKKRKSLLDHAATVLKRSKRPMKTGEIVERAAKAGWKTNGKTPAATLHSLMSREIREKGTESRFAKGGERGMFTLGKGA